MMATNTPSIKFYILSVLVALSAIPLIYAVSRGSKNPVFSIVILPALLLVPLVSVLVRSAAARWSFALGVLLTGVLPASLVVIFGGIDNSSLAWITGVTILVGYILTFILSNVFGWTLLGRSAVGALIWTALFGLIGLEFIFAAAAALDLSTIPF